VSGRCAMIKKLIDLIAEHVAREHLAKRGK
jgi:hypothetical protein